jgi:molybdopterin synthase catalytic subunit
MICLQADPIRVETLVSHVRGNDDGAVALFLGTVRDHNRGRRVLRLDYQAYEEMAESEMQRLENRALERFEIHRVAVVHRTGVLQIGEVSVAVAVGAAHRAQALEACRFLIDTLKRTVPIWKKEYFEGGETWIEGDEGGSA